eukprot:1032436-Prorocentrum_minimum.AAC.1
MVTVEFVKSIVRLANMNGDILDPEGVEITGMQLGSLLVESTAQFAFAEQVRTRVPQHLVRVPQHLVGVPQH